MLTALKTLPKGEYVKRTETAKTVYIKGEYCRSEKKYELKDAEDINRCVYVSGDKLVAHGFTY